MTLAGIFRSTRSVATWLFRLTVFVALVMGIALVGVRLTGLQMSRAAGEATLLATRMILIFVVTGSLISLVLWAWRRVLSFHRSSEITPTVLMAGLTLAALLVPEGVEALIISPFVVILTLFAGQVDEGIASAQTIDAAISAVPADLLTRQLLLASARTMTGSATALLTSIRHLPVQSMLLAVLACAAVEFLMRNVSDGIGGQSASLALWWQSMDAPRRRLVGVTITLIIGTYLSIAAIVAIPWLMGEKGNDANLTAQALESQLARFEPAGNLDTTSFVRDSVRISASLRNLSEAIAAAAVQTQRMSPSESERAAPILKDLAANVENVRSERQRTAEALDRARTVSRRKLAEPRARAVTAFTTNSGRQMTAAERAFYFESLLDWAHQATASATDEIDSFAFDMRQFDRVIVEWATATTSAMTSLRALNSRDSVALAYILDHGIAPFPSSATPSFSSRRSGDDQIPPPPEPGLGWGPFAKLANWLLRTRSVALAQIAGMLGFGLFGAALSAWRTRWDTTTPATVATDDVPAVLIGAFSATLVVFLAVNGGLAVLSDTEAKPNSYVLFFLCFVGAVYSQDIWAWARTKLRKTFPQQ